MGGGREEGRGKGGRMDGGRKRLAGGEGGKRGGKQTDEPDRRVERRTLRGGSGWRGGRTPTDGSGGGPPLAGRAGVGLKRAGEMPRERTGGL